MKKEYIFDFWKAPNGGCGAWVVGLKNKLGNIDDPMGYFAQEEYARMVVKKLNSELSKTKRR